MSDDFVLTKLEQAQTILDEIRVHLQGRPEPEKKTPYEKAISYSLNDIKWTEMSPTEKGKWSRATDLDNQGNGSYQKLKEVLRGQSPCSLKGGGRAWLLQSGDGIGYRAREWQVSKLVEGER